MDTGYLLPYGSQPENPSRTTRRYSNYAVGGCKFEPVVDIYGPEVQPSSYDSKPKRARRAFKPLVHRSPLLLLLGLILLALIGFIEYGLHTLPRKTFAVAKPASKTSSPFKKRQGDFLSTSLDDSGPLTTTSPTISDDTGEVTGTMAYYTSSNAHVSTGPTTSTLPRPTPSTTSSSAPIDGDVTTFIIEPTPAHSLYIDDHATTSTIAYFSTALGAYVNGDVTTEILQQPPSGESTTTVLNTSTAPSAYINGDVTTKTPRRPLGGERTTISLDASTAPSAYGDPAATTSTKGQSQDPSGYLISKATYITSSFTATPSLVVATVTRTSGTQIWRVTSTSTFIPKSIGTSTPSPTDSAKAILDSDKPLSFIHKKGVYFGGVYLPVLFSVLVRMLLGYLYSSTKMMEPFYLLARPNGANAREFLFTNYLDSNDLLAPLLAIVSRQWLVLCAAGIYMFAQVLGPFASELIEIHPSVHIADRVLTKGSAIWINSSVARIIQGILALICLLLVVLWFLLFSQHSGIYGDPSSIATVASLANNPDVVHEFRQFDANCEKRDIVRYLSHQRFRIGAYQGVCGPDYGLVLSRESPFTDIPKSLSKLPSESLQSSSAMSQLLSAEHHPFPQIDRPLPLPSPERHGRPAIVSLLNIILILSILGLLGVIVAYYKDGGDTGFNRFFNSQTFGPRFLLTIAGMLIKSQWSRIERVAATNDPFWKLFRQPCLAESTILAPRTLEPISTLIIGLSRRSWYIALVALTTIFAEVLIVVLPGVPYSSGQLWAAARVTWYLCMALLGFMCIALVVVWFSKSEPWPRAPNTIGAMMLYLAGTRVASEMERFAECEGKERDREVRAWGRMYSFAKTRDCGQGNVSWSVDFDEMDDPELLTRPYAS